MYLHVESNLQWSLKNSLIYFLCPFFTKMIMTRFIFCTMMIYLIWFYTKLFYTKIYVTVFICIFTVEKKMHLNMLNRYGPIYLYVHYIHTCTNICTYIYLINTYITYVVKVSREGHFTSRGPSKANYSAMILVRVTIVNWCSVILSNSSTITVRYSAVRRQSTLDSR